MPNNETWKALAEGKPVPKATPKGASPPDAYREAAEKTAAQNRPDQQNAFNSTVSWETGPDGRPIQKQGFGGPLGGLSQSLQGQASSSMGTPLSFAGLPQAVGGQQARDQAISSAYGQATSRLDPQWQQRESMTRTQLMNQGLDPTSEAYRSEMDSLGRQRNDAYSSAMSGAVQQGTAAGDSVFRNSLMDRARGLSEALTGRSLPMQEMLAMRGLTEQPGFMPGANYLGALSAADMAKLQAEANSADVWGGIANLATGGLAAGAGLIGKK